MQVDRLTIHCFQIHHIIIFATIKHSAYTDAIIMITQLLSVLRWFIYYLRLPQCVRSVFCLEFYDRFMFVNDLHEEGGAWAVIQTELLFIACRRLSLISLIFLWVPLDGQ